MSKSNKKKRFGVVYSTNDHYDYQHENNEEETLPPNEQTLNVHLEKKGRGGKTVVIIRGFVGTQDDLNTLAKRLKSSCGVGGSAKDGEIILQGDKRDKILSELEKAGYKVKRVGA